jgi:hypothetical protein
VMPFEAWRERARRELADEPRWRWLSLFTQLGCAELEGELSAVREDDATRAALALERLGPAVAGPDEARRVLGALARTGYFRGGREEG